MKRWVVLAAAAVVVAGLGLLGWQQVARHRDRTPIASLSFTADTRGMSESRTLVLDGDYVLHLDACQPASMTEPLPASATIHLEVMVGESVVHRVELQCPAPARQLTIHIVRTGKGPVWLRLADSSQAAAGGAQLSRA